MFWCNDCERDVKDEKYFDEDDNAFRCSCCGRLVEYVNN